MALAKLNKQSLFKDELTFEFLHQSYSDYRKLGEEMALAEIHSIQMPMPGFNTLATLNKAEFSKFMIQLQRKQIKDGKVFTIMVAGVIDTFTCMIQNRRFYECFDHDNKNGLNILMRLLHTVKYLVVHYKALDSTQLKVLIDIIDRSAKRIENETETYRLIEEVLQTLKCALVNNENNSNKENNFEKLKIESMKMIKNNNVKNTNDVGKKFVLKDCRKLTPKLDTSIIGLPVKTPDTKSKELVTTELPRLSDSDEVSKNKRSANAFDIMMMSSKLITKKKKLTV